MTPTNNNVITFINFFYQIFNITRVILKKEGKGLNLVIVVKYVKKKKYC